jgi:hypothetical protein
LTIHNFIKPIDSTNLERSAATIKSPGQRDRG